MLWAAGNSGVGALDERASATPHWRRGSTSEIYCWTAAAVVALAVMLSLRTRLEAAAPGTVFTVGWVAALAGMVCCHRIYRTRENSASFLFLLVFSLFNLGLAPFFIFDLTITPPDTNSSTIAWLSSPLLSTAVLLATIGVITLVLGFCLGAAWGSRRHPRRGRSDDLDEPAMRKALGLPACIVLLVSVAIFLAYILGQGGIGAFTGGYDNFRTSGASGPTSYLYPLIGMSGGMAALAAPSRARTVALTVFGGFTLLMLAVGLRSEVFFPVFGAIVLVGFRRRVLTVARLVVVAVAAMVLITVVGAARNGNVHASAPTQVVSATGPAIGSSATSLDPLDALVELGYSLRPTVVVLQWQQAGQAPLDGASFVSPFYRTLHRIVPELGPALPASEDPDLLNEVVANTPGVGAIGFSQTAEAYDNWGFAGVVGFLLLLGLIMSWIDRSPRNILSQLIRVSFFIPLLVEVRNAFTAVPIQIALAIVLSVMVVLTARGIARSGAARAMPPRMPGLGPPPSAVGATAYPGRSGTTAVTSTR